MNRLSTDLINYITTFLKWNDYYDFFISINKKINLPLYLKLSKTTLTIDDVCNNEREYLQAMKDLLTIGQSVNLDNISSACKNNHVNILKLLIKTGNYDMIRTEKHKKVYPNLTDQIQEIIMKCSSDVITLYRELEYNSFIKKNAEKGNYIQISGCSFIKDIRELGRKRYEIGDILSEDIDTEYNQMLEYKNKDIYEELEKHKNDVIDIPYDEEKFLEFLHRPCDL